MKNLQHIVDSKAINIADAMSASQPNTFTFPPSYPSIGSKVGFRKKMETKFLPRRIKISGGGYFAKKKTFCVKSGTWSDTPRCVFPPVTKKV